MNRVRKINDIHTRTERKEALKKTKREEEVFGILVQSVVVESVFTILVSFFLRATCVSV